MFESLAIWYLRKRKKTVMMGYDLKGGKLQPRNRKAYAYDNVFQEVDFRDYDGTEFDIPEGKFRITTMIKATGESE